MWMREPDLYSVAVPLRGRLALPAGRCCNCGSADDVAVEPVTLRHTIFLLLGGTEQRVTLALPACPMCRVTLFRSSPGLVKRVFYAFIWSFLGMLGFALVLSTLGVRPFGLGGLALVSSLAAFGATSWWYATRRPRGAQTSYFQPVRFRGAFDRDGQAYAFFDFTNRAVAAEVTAALPPSLPEARVVRR